MTPLASIMGSGFLVSAPLLAGVTGIYAALSMGCLLLLAYSIGSAVRFNIEHFEPIEDEKGIAQEIAFVSRLVLSGAYFISVTYYIQLLAAFALNFFSIKNALYSNYLATGIVGVIGSIAILKGLSILEKVEKYAVSLNLGMIGALLFALFVYNGEHLIAGTWALPQLATEFNFDSLRVVLGLLIVVQGFETSRYLGNSYTKEERISSMKLAQLISAIIYILFISLSTILFKDGLSSDVTAIISMVAPISIVLPVLLSAAAIVSQFSAAVADTEGASGLVRDLVHNKISEKVSYAIILAIVVTLTWETSVNEIISYASRAFALFYALQCLVATMISFKSNKKVNKAIKFKFIISFLLSILVFALGLPAE